MNHIRTHSLLNYNYRSTVDFLLSAYTVLLIFRTKLNTLILKIADINICLDINRHIFSSSKLLLALNKYYVLETLQNTKEEHKVHFLKYSLFN